MNNLDTVLRDGKELGPGELEEASKFEDMGICSIETTCVMRCVHPEDGDYTAVRDRDCDRSIEYIKEQERYICPECGREFFASDKTKFSKNILTVDEDGIRDTVRNAFKQATDTSVQTKPGGSEYLDTNIQPVLQVHFDDGRLPILIISDAVDRRTLKWVRICEPRVICILVDDAISLIQELDTLEIPSVTLGSLLNSSENSAVDVCDDLVGSVKYPDKESIVELRARLSAEMCTQNDVLERMDWREFEFCVDNLLSSAVATSVLFGGTEPGSGYPDGALSFHWNRKKRLHAWDAKFVDLVKNEETHLADEYDKIFRHISEMDSSPSNLQKFNGVSGMILFSPGIKQANIVRLADFIHERQMLRDIEWAGWISYFSLDALLQLYRNVQSNESNVRQKPDAYHQALHRLLTSSGRHQDEPSVIEESDYNCVHVSECDITRLFDYIGTQPEEVDKFDREAYAEYREWNFTS